MQKNQCLFRVDRYKTKSKWNFKMLPCMIYQNKHFFFCIQICRFEEKKPSYDSSYSGYKKTTDQVTEPLEVHDDVIKWKHFPRYWPFVRGIHRSPVNSPHKGQWHGTLMFSLICAWINGWANNREAGDLRRHRAHYDVIVMYIPKPHSPLRRTNLPTDTGLPSVRSVFSFIDDICLSSSFIVICLQCPNLCYGCKRPVL